MKIVNKTQGLSGKQLQLNWVREMIKLERKRRHIGDVIFSDCFFHSRNQLNFFAGKTRFVVEDTAVWIVNLFKLNFISQIGKRLQPQDRFKNCGGPRLMSLLGPLHVWKTRIYRQIINICVEIFFVSFLS